MIRPMKLTPVLLCIFCLCVQCGCVAFWRSDVEGFYSRDTEIIDDVWIYPELYGEGVSFDLVPIVVWGTEHGPYAAGISAVDHSNLYQRLELTQLTIQQGSRKKIVVQKDAPVISPFLKTDAHPRSTTVKAVCIIDIGEWPDIASNVPVNFSASFLMHGTNRQEKGTLEAVMNPMIINGVSWFEPIHD